jgi:hypothetical protein
VRGSKKPEDRERPELAESLFAMCATSDVNTSAAYLEPGAVAQWWAVRERADIADAQFIGFWRDDCPAEALTDRALASAYLGDDAVIIAVTNRLPEAVDVRVRVDLEALGPGADATATDLRTEETLPFEGGVVSVPVGARSYTYLEIVR